MWGGCPEYTRMVFISQYSFFFSTSLNNLRCMYLCTNKQIWMVCGGICDFMRKFVLWNWMPLRIMYLHVLMLYACVYVHIFSKIFRNVYFVFRSYLFYDCIVKMRNIACSCKRISFLFRLNRSHPVFECCCCQVFISGYS